MRQLIEFTVVMTNGANGNMTSTILATGSGHYRQP